jgi:hypothetical protein
MALPISPFDTTKSIAAGKAVIQLKTVPQITGVTAATSTLTKTANGLSNGRLLQYVSGTGFTNLVAGTNYFVVSAATDTFGLSATKGGTAIAVGTSSAGIFQPVHVFESILLTSKMDQQLGNIMAPDSSGILRKAREWVKSQAENFPFDLLEVKRLTDIFDGSLAGRKTGTASLWIPDPDDVTGVIALKSETDFACTVTREGDLPLGNSEASKTSINISSNKAGAVTWTEDVAP